MSLSIVITVSVGEGGGRWLGGDERLPRKSHGGAFLEAFGCELQFWVPGQKGDVFMHTDLALGSVQRNTLSYSVILF